MPKIRQHITFRDFERRNLHDRMGSSAGSIFVPRKNKVVVQAKNVKTGIIEETRETHNLIVYHGRSWLMQRAFGFPLGVTGSSEYESRVMPWDNIDEIDESIAEERENYSNMYLCWFGLGNGGAEEADPLTPIAVSSYEYELSQIAIGDPNSDNPGPNPTGPDGNNIRYGDTGAMNDYHAIDPFYPLYLYDPDVAGEDGDGVGGDPNYTSMENLAYDETKCDAYMRALVRVTVQPEEYNGLAYYDPEQDADDFANVNEAGLYFARSHDPEDYDLTSGTYRYANSNEHDLQLFAKVNFSSIRKDETRQLIFSWYFYF